MKRSLMLIEPKRLRAIVEIIDGELKIYPISDSDFDERAILDALRFVREDFDRHE